MRRSTVLAYIRLSFGRDDAESPARQEAAIRSWCKRNGFKRIEVYRDIEGRRSGRKEKGRPAWAELRQRMHDPDVAAVAVEMLERMYRNGELQLAFKEKCLKAGVRLVSVVENFDFRPHTQRIPLDADRNAEMTEVIQHNSLQNFAAVAELWANLTSAKMKSHVRDKHANGKHWGTCPFGTTRNEAQKLVPSPDGVWFRTPDQWRSGNPTDPTGWQFRSFHAALIRLYEIYAEASLGWDGVADQLNLEGYRFLTRKGEPRPVNGDDVRRCLDMHLTYSGHLIAGRSQGKQGAEILVYDAWEPILSLTLIEQARAVLETRRRQQLRLGQRSVYALTPLLYCSECKARLEGQLERSRSPGNEGTRFYRHSHRGKCRARVGQINAEQIEVAVAQLVGDLALPPEDWPFIEAALRAAVETGRGGEEQAELDKLRRQRDRLKELYTQQFLEETQVLSWDAYKTKLARFDEQIAVLETKLGQTLDMAGVRQAMRHVTSVSQIIQKAGAQTRKELCASFFDRLEVDLSRGEIKRYTPAPWAKTYLDTVITSSLWLNAHGGVHARLPQSPSITRFVRALAKAV